MTLPKRVEHRQPRVRRDVASALRSAAAGLTIPSRRARRRRQRAGHGPGTADAARRAASSPAHRIGDREAKVRIAERVSATRAGDRAAARARSPRPRTRWRARSTGSSGCSPNGGSSTQTPTERCASPTTGGCWPGSIRRATFWWRSACVAGCGSDLHPAELGRRGVGGGVRVPRRRRARGAAMRRIFRPPRCGGRWPRPGGWRPHCAPTSRRHRLNPSREPDEGFVTAVLPLGHHRRSRHGPGGSDVARAGDGTPLSGRRFRALVPPGARPARSDPDRGRRQGTAQLRETRNRRHSARRCRS